MLGSKRYFAPNLISTNCSAAKQLPQFSNIRNPLIYCVNRYFLMFGGFQGKKLSRASTKSFSLWNLVSDDTMSRTILFAKSAIGTLIVIDMCHIICHRNSLYRTVLFTFFTADTFVRGNMKRCGRFCDCNAR